MRTLVVNGLRLTKTRTGPGRHVEYLAREWAATEVPFDRVVFATPRPTELDGRSERIASVTFGEQLPLGVWEQWALPRFARRASVLFCPAYSAPILHRGGMVVANHGFYERIPDEFSRSERLRSIPIFRLSARRATRVIANSENTRRDLVELFHVPPERIDVVYPAADEQFFERFSEEEIDREVASVLGERAPYLLFVGKLSRRRHVPNLIAAFARLRREGFEHRLVVVAPPSRVVDVEATARAEGVGDAVVRAPHLGQDRLARLYAGADAFVLPTTYEGISQTMFEAMASNVPVVTVDHPTVHEGAAECVVIAPSPSVNDLGAAIGSLLRDPTGTRAMVERAAAYVRTYSWSKTAMRTLEILDRVALPRDRG